MYRFRDYVGLDAILDKLFLLRFDRQIGVVTMINLLLLAGCETRETRLQQFLLKGNTMMMQRNYDHARAYYRRALEVDSCFADAWNNLGMICYHERDYATAIDCYDRALACNPDFWNARLNRANAFYQTNELTSALQDIEYLAALKPDTSVVHFSRGLVFARQRDYRQAVEAFRKAQAADTSNTEIRINLGTVYYYSRQFDSARAELNVALTGKSKANACNVLALIAAEEQDFQQAYRMIGEALRLEPGNAYFLNNRGYIHLLAGQPDSALVDINNSIVRDPYNGWAYRNKGLYYLMTGDTDAAIRLLQQAGQLDPSVEKLYYYLGEAFRKKGDIQHACEYFRKAIDNGDMSREKLIGICKP